MTPEEHRQRASELIARAETESLPGRRALLLQMAKEWSGLAQWATTKVRTTWSETPPSIGKRDNF